MIDLVMLAARSASITYTPSNQHLLTYTYLLTYKVQAMRPDGRTCSRFTRLKL